MDNPATELYSLLALLADHNKVKQRLDQMTAQQKALAEATEQHKKVQREAHALKQEATIKADHVAKLEKELAKRAVEVEKREVSVAVSEKELREKTLATQAALDQRERSLAKAESTIMTRLQQAEKDAAFAARAREIADKKIKKLQEMDAIA